MISISSIRRGGYLLLYYGFARFLPPSNLPIVGKFGGRLRRYCAKHLFAFCADDANIERMAYFGSGRNVEIGSRSGIGIHCHVPNNIKIGQDVMMGPHCTFMSTDTHRYDRTDIPMIDQGRYDSGRRPIIGDDVWIGRECFMTGGKCIGNHTIVGARSVISKDIPDYVVAAGNPIRVVRYRLDKNDNKKIEYNEDSSRMHQCPME